MLYALLAVSMPAYCPIRSMSKRLYFLGLNYVIIMRYNINKAYISNSVIVSKEIN